MGHNLANHGMISLKADVGLHQSTTRARLQQPRWGRTGAAMGQRRDYAGAVLELRFKRLSLR